ncbi:MAG: HpsJ family protein [Cyanobacteria bacterium P01_H01_bin.119]
MSSINPPAVSPLAVISLKLVGKITIVASLIDYLVLLLPPQFLNTQWQLATTTQLVDRGIVPLVGIALLFAGGWIEGNLGIASRNRNLLIDSRFWACILASLLGLLFAALTVLHPNNVRITSRDALGQIGTQANEASTQLEQRFTQQRDQLSVLLANEDQLQQAIESGQIAPEQLGFLQQFQGDPAGLDQFLEDQLGQAREQAESQISTRRTQAEQQIRQEAWKSGIRVAISSLLLAIGYIVIGWTGLRRLLFAGR